MHFMTVLIKHLAGLGPVWRVAIQGIKMDTFLRCQKPRKTKTLKVLMTNKVCVFTPVDPRGILPKSFGVTSYSHKENGTYLKQGVQEFLAI